MKMQILILLSLFPLIVQSQEAAGAEAGSEATAAPPATGGTTTAVAGYVGPDTYREGYSGGDLQNNLVLWKLPEGGKQHYVKPYPYIPEQVTILESSRFKYPTKADPEQSTAINLAHFIIDSNLQTKWWSAIDELQSWIEIDLGNPAHRIKDEDSLNFFLWKYYDQIEAGRDIEYLDGGLIGFHIDRVVIRWSEMFASADYKIQSSIDKIQWKDRAVQLEMPNEYDRVDIIPGWSVQGVGNTRYLRITMVERVYAKNAWGNREGIAWDKEQKEKAAAANAAASAAAASAAGEDGGGRRLWNYFSMLWNHGLRGSDSNDGYDGYDGYYDDNFVFYGGTDPRRNLGYNNMPSDEGFITPEEQYEIGQNRDAAAGTERTVYGIREIEIIGPVPSNGVRHWISSSLVLVVVVFMLWW